MQIIFLIDPLTAVLCSSAERNRRADAENRTAHEAAQRVEAEARAQAAREALESARAESIIAAAGKEEAQTRARTEAIKRHQAEAQVGSQCIPSIRFMYVKMALAANLHQSLNVCVLGKGCGLCNYRPPHTILGQSS